MVMTKHPKEKQITINDTTTYEQQIAAIKKAAFTALAAHLQQNCEAPQYPFYLFLILEHLALMWYLVHPGLNVYQGAYLVSQATSFLKVLNPHEFMRDAPNLYKSLILVCGLYLAVQLLLASISIYATLKGKSGDFFKYLRKIVNYQFLFTAKTLSGPMLALVVNVVYCDSKIPYHSGHTCYDAPYVMICAVAALIGLVLLIQILIFSSIYYFRNPLNSSYMGVQNRYYVLSKSILKAMMPLYFAVDPQYSLSIVYMFTVTGLLGFYIFWHRLLSVHSYNQKHFYVEYFLEGALLWMAASNLIYYYASNGPVLEEFSFIYTLFSAAFVAGLLLSVEARAQEMFLKECLGGKVKKQNMEKFIFVLIHRLLYSTAAESRIRFKTYLKLLVKNGSIPLVLGTNKEDEQSAERENQVQVYNFLSTLLQAFLAQNNSTMLKAVRCHLLCLLGLRSYGIHQSLQLEQQRLSLVEQLMLFQFRRGVNLFENQVIDKQNRQFIKFYRFHEEFGRLEVYVQACGKNNAEYWQQLCEADPSLAKLRNLATLYSLYQQRITDQYTKITQIVPESLHATTLYLSFLGTAGIDVRLQLRMREKLGSIFETRRKNAKISSEELKQDQEMSIITLDTVGNNIGMVLNSNSHVKELLGYERTALLGKNITKIMPKIYTQLHNQIMLSFIRSEHSHQTSVKRVTALNRNSLLVSINLSVRILSSSQSDLAIVGFMKRLPSEKFVGLMMYSLNNGEVLGVDQNFVDMMNQRLSGKQVVQQELRLSVLVPELNMQQLEKEKEQETVLELGSSVEEERDTQIQKKVLIRLKNIKIYEGAKLGFLEIVDLTRYRAEAANSKLSSSFGSRMPRTNTKQFLIDIPTNHRASNRKATIDYSINLQESYRPLNQEDDSGRYVAISRRMQQFVKSKEGGGVGWALKILYTVCVLGCLTTALYTYVSHSDYLKQQRSLYLSLNQTIKVASTEAAINTYVSKIWDTRAVNYFPNHYQKYSQILDTYIADLRNTHSQLTITLRRYSYPLEYNEQNRYNISFSHGINQKIVRTIRPATYADVMSNYIIAAGFFRQFMLNNSTAPGRLILQLYALFVQHNGEQLLPDIAISAMSKCYALFMYSMDEELIRMVLFKALLMVVIVVCFACILLLAHHIDKVSMQVVQVYTNVKLDDVGQVLLRWKRFLGQRGIKLFDKQRTSSMLRMVTAKAIDIPPQKQYTPITVSRPKQQAQQAQVLTTEQPLIMQSEANQERLMTFQDQHSQAEALVDTEHALLRGRQQQPTIKIDEQRSNSKMTIALVIFFCVFGAVAICSYLQIDSNATSLKGYMRRLKIVGEIKKTVSFIDYYGYRVTIDNSDAHVKELLTAEIASFFQLTQEGYVYLGDPRPILKDTYSLVQTIQQWLTVPNVTSNGILSANYQKLDEGLQKTISQIDQLDSSTFYPQFKEQMLSASKVELFLTLTLIGLMCLAVLALHGLHLGPIRIQGRHSLNMLKILPASLLQKNPNAMKVIATT